MRAIRAPLRVSFFGGGTDSPEFVERCGPGLVLGTAIDVYVEYDLADDKWTIPVSLGTGLGTSSAMCVVTERVHGLPASDHDVAWNAWKTERYGGSSVGWQDAAFAAFGGFNLIEFHANHFTVERVSTPRLPEIQSHLVLLYTGANRKRDVAADSIKRIGDNTTMLKLSRQMAEEGHKMLTGTVSMQSFGSLLHGAWMTKKTMSPNVSNKTIDALYEKGINAGAWGGKLLGAGGGGYLLFVVCPEKRKDVVKATGLSELPFRIDAAI